MKELQTLAPENQDIWVKHIIGEEVDLSFSTLVELPAEEVLAKVTNQLQQMYGMDEVEAKTVAVHLLTAEFLKLQRNIAPGGHIAHFESCFAVHPDLDNLRNEAQSHTPYSSKVSSILGHKLIDWAGTAVMILLGAGIVKYFFGS